MQALNWNDLRYVLAISRSGRISTAARSLGVDDTTVSRRLKALEGAMKSELFVRFSDGALKANETGSAIVRHAERMENEASAIRTVLGEKTQKLVGAVRITSVPTVVNRILVPSLKNFLTAHPDLTVELIPEARDLSLTRREADLAIRLARPAAGGARVKARRIGLLSYAIFVPKDCAADMDHALDWIAYDEAMSHLPQARWLAGLRKPYLAQLSGLRVSDAETAIEAVANGFGKALLPTCVAAYDRRLRQIDAKGLPAPPVREVWLLSHTDQRDLNSIQKVMAWIEEIRWSNDG